MDRDEVNQRARLKGEQWTLAHPCHNRASPNGRTSSDVDSSPESVSDIPRHEDAKAHTE